MHVRVNYGVNAGRVVEFPYHVGREIVASGRGERVDPTAEPLEASNQLRTAEPARQHGDPVAARATAVRRGRR